MAINNENISKRLISAFNAKDLKEVASKIDEKYTSLHNWTSGRRDFPTEVLIKIAKMTNVSIGWILTGEGEKDLKSHKQTSLDETFRDIVREIVREELTASLKPEIPSTQVQDLGTVDAFDVEDAVEKYATLEETLEAWYKFEGKNLPEGFGLNFSGWAKLSHDAKVATVKDIKTFADKMSDEIDKGEIDFE